MALTVKWDGSLLRANGVAIFDGEARRGQRVIVGLRIGRDGKAMYLINPDAGCDATAEILVPVSDKLDSAKVTYA